PGRLLPRPAGRCRARQPAPRPRPARLTGARPPRRGRPGILCAMAKLLLNMRMVPADEAEDVRGFLAEHGIAFHETKPSRWGISHGGIWVSDDRDYPRARSLMDAYQAARSERVRAEYAQARADGSAETFA